MATTPQFANTPNNGSLLLTTAETNLQVPTVATANIIAAGANGSIINEIVVEASATTLVATTVAGLVYIFLFDGTTAHLFDTYTVTAITASTTVPGFRLRTVYTNEIIKTGWSVRASQSIAGNASILKCHVFALDY